MKTFNMEDDREVVYVQKKDLITAIYCMEKLPRQLLKLVNKKKQELISGDEDEFIAFDDKKIIEFFDYLDFDIDYKEYLKLSLKEIMQIATNEASILGMYARQYNSENPKSLDMLAKLICNYEKQLFKLNDIAKIVYIKQGKATLDFPLVMDSDSKPIMNLSNNLVTVKSLDPNRYIIVSDSKIPLKLSYQIPRCYIRNVICKIATDRLDNEIYSDNINSELDDRTFKNMIVLNILQNEEEKEAKSDNVYCLSKYRRTK